MIGTIQSDMGNASFRNKKLNEQSLRKNIEKAFKPKKYAIIFL